MQTSVKPLGPHKNEQEVFYNHGIQLGSELAETFTKKQVVSSQLHYKRVFPRANSAMRSVWNKE